MSKLCWFTGKKRPVHQTETNNMIDQHFSFFVFVSFQSGRNSMEGDA